MAHATHGEQGLPEWIMSYADMITILMAFFVVMYSMAGTNKTPDTAAEQAVLKSLHDRFGPNWVGMVGLWPGPNRGGYGPLLKGGDGGAGSKRNHRDSRKTNGRPTASDRSRAEVTRPGKLAAVGGVLYFAEGSTRLSRQHERQIQAAVDEIAGKPQRIEVRGHTSRRPTPGNQDHWDLAYARCRVAMDSLVKAGIDPRRIRLGVAADNEPMGNPDDAVAMSQSSRVEIFLLDEFVGPTDALPETRPTQPRTNQPAPTDSR